jgi:signal transduction histidine kinase
VLHNLLDNSVQAYDAGRARMPIQVSARVLLAGAQVEIRVVDRGRGIRPEDVPKIFLPFGSGKPGGTGLGMLTVKKMIEDVHGGELAPVESTVDAGTTVTIRLPARQPGVRPDLRAAERR